MILPTFAKSLKEDSKEKKNESNFILFFCQKYQKCLTPKQKFGIYDIYYERGGNMSNLEAEEYKSFESIKKVREDGSEYWSARELGKVLEYKNRKTFLR